MKTHKNPAEERENLLIQAQNLYKQKYNKFPEEDGYKLNHIYKNEIIFASSEDSVKAYIKYKSRDKQFLKNTLYLVVIEVAVLIACYYMYKHEFIDDYIWGIIIFLVMWVVIISGIAVRLHNIKNKNLRIIYHEHIVSVKLHKQKVKLI